MKSIIRHEEELKEAVLLSKNLYATPNATAPTRPIIFDPDLCIGCNTCVDVCQMDVFIPNPEKGEPPIIVYPDECWYEGCCVVMCPAPGAIRLNHPLMQRVRWKRKETGEHLRV
jgi:NAD-dependent dihydropyrimidine dehydrogenase PreA subunit